MPFHLPLGGMDDVSDDVFSYMCNLAMEKCSEKGEKKKASCGGAAMRKRLLIKNFVAQMLNQEKQSRGEDEGEGGAKAMDCGELQRFQKPRSCSSSTSLTADRHLEKEDEEVADEEGEDEEEIEGEEEDDEEEGEEARGEGNKCSEKVNNAFDDAAIMEEEEKEEEEKKDEESDAIAILSEKRKIESGHRPRHFDTSMLFTDQVSYFEMQQVPISNNNNHHHHHNANVGMGLLNSLDAACYYELEQVPIPALNNNNNNSNNNNNAQNIVDGEFDDFVGSFHAQACYFEMEQFPFSMVGAGGEAASGLLGCPPFFAMLTDELEFLDGGKTHGNNNYGNIQLHHHCFSGSVLGLESLETGMKLDDEEEEEEEVDEEEEEEEEEEVDEEEEIVVGKLDFGNGSSKNNKQFRDDRIPTRTFVLDAQFEDRPPRMTGQRSCSPSQSSELRTFDSQISFAGFNERGVEEAEEKRRGEKGNAKTGEELLADNEQRGERSRRHSGERCGLASGLEKHVLCEKKRRRSRSCEARHPKRPRCDTNRELMMLSR